jgi:peptidoglycan hydrolase-like protein with peptidoglycan-binding domain
MENIELQRRLKDLDFYRGPIDGKIGPLSMQAIAAFLNNGRVVVPEAWSKERRVLAAKQLVCRRDNIEVGAIDGLLGPQTAFAFRVYAERHTGSPSTLIHQRDVDPPHPLPAHLHPVWPRQSQVEEFFGGMGIHQTKLTLPFPMKIAWEPTKTITNFSIHEKVHDSAKRCFERIAEAYDAEAREKTGINIYGGCFNVRKMRGGKRWSMHSWGIAIDFDPDRNSLSSNRATARLAQPDCLRFWQIWEEEGWVSLGRTCDFDWMHVQAARL